MCIKFAVIGNSRIFATLLKQEVIGRLAQLVQSICLTSRGSAVRIRQRPPKNEALHTMMQGFFYINKLRLVCMVMKTLLLVDNQDITREGMKAVAGRVGGFTVIKEAGSQKELTRLLIDHPNAVVVFDYTLFDTSAEYLLILQERFKEAHFILFSDSLSEDFIRRMVFGGTSFSVVMKDAPMIEIEEGLRKAEQRLQYICTRIAWQLQHKEEKKEKRGSSLTVTECEILKLMALGKTTKEIAAERFLSVYTVMTHRKNIFRKLEVNNVYEATKYALRAGIVDAVEYYI